MNTKDLLKEAIADAKAVRETALAQAKLALEEAFTPRLQSMFAAKLAEAMDEEDEDKKPMEEMMDDTDAVEETKAEEAKEKMSMEEDTIDEINLDEILAELDAELEEAKMNKDDLQEAKEEEEIEAEEDVEDEEADEEESKEEEKEVSELSMDELEELIRDIVSQEMEPGDETEVEADMMDDTEMELPDTTDDEVNLEEILAELLGEEEILQEAKKKVKKAKEEKKEEKDEDKEKLKEELKLALDTVGTLRQELQEVNLLNAKLLYVNKIFKAKNLTESQKIKVVQAFDKAESAKEAKLVYESLSQTFTAKAEKSQIKESLGFASKAAGVAEKPASIVESNDFIARMKKLANIK
jgi:hypothetical protein